MERVREYGGFAVWFLGLGYIVAWALMPERLGMLPAGLHAIGLTASAFLPWRGWVYFRDRNKPAVAATSIQTLVRDYHRIVGSPPLVPTRPKVKPRAHFGLRGMSHAETAPD